MLGIRIRNRIRGIRRYGSGSGSFSFLTKVLIGLKKCLKNKILRKIVDIFNVLVIDVLQASKALACIIKRVRKKLWVRIFPCDVMVDLQNIIIYTQKAWKTPGSSPFCFDPKLLCKILLMQSPQAKMTWNIETASGCTNFIFTNCYDQTQLVTIPFSTSYNFFYCIIEPAIAKRNLLYELKFNSRYNFISYYVLPCLLFSLEWNNELTFLNLKEYALLSNSAQFCQVKIILKY